jgi:choline kinase
MIGRQKELDQRDYLDLDGTARQYTASVSRRRLSGRPSIERLGSSKSRTLEGNPSLTSLLTDSSTETHGHHHHEGLLKQVSAWIKHERSRRIARKAKRKGTGKDGSHDKEPAKEVTGAADHTTSDHARRGSESSQGSVALDELANILEKTLSIKPADTKRKYNHVRKLSAGLKRHSIVSNDSDYFESVDQLVPNCEAILDNSKTMAYTTDSPELEPVTEKSEKKARKEKEAWDKFKYEILRIVHTLRLKGWRKVPMELSDQMDVQRLSGALTNAVYVVSPPKDLPSHDEHADGVPKPKNPPPYGIPLLRKRMHTDKFQEAFVAYIRTASGASHR